jgi:predicted DNA-binding ribbon-helix-helix protein
MLREIAAECGLTVKALIEGIIVTKNPSWPLTSALRLYIAEYWRNANGPRYYIDLDHGTRRPRSQRSGISDSGRPPRPRAA